MAAFSESKPIAPIEVPWEEIPIDAVRICLVQPIMHPKYRKMQAHELNELSDAEISKAYGSYGVICYLFWIDDWKPKIYDYVIFSVLYELTDYPVKKKIDFIEFWEKHKTEFEFPVFEKASIPQYIPRLFKYPNSQKMFKDYRKYINDQLSFNYRYRMTVWNATDHLKTFSRFLVLTFQIHPMIVKLDHYGFMYKPLREFNVLFTDDWQDRISKSQRGLLLIRPIIHPKYEAMKNEDFQTLPSEIQLEACGAYGFILFHYSIKMQKRTDLKLKDITIMSNKYVHSFARNIKVPFTEFFSSTVQLSFKIPDKKQSRYSIKNLIHSSQYFDDSENLASALMNYIQTFKTSYRSWMITLWQGDKLYQSFVDFLIYNRPEIYPPGEIYFRYTGLRNFQSLFTDFWKDITLANFVDISNVDRRELLVRWPPPINPPIFDARLPLSRAERPFSRRELRQRDRQNLNRLTPSVADLPSTLQEQSEEFPLRYSTPGPSLLQDDDPLSDIDFYMQYFG